MNTGGLYEFSIQAIKNTESLKEEIRKSLETIIRVPTRVRGIDENKIEVYSIEFMLIKLDFSECCDIVQLFVRSYVGDLYNTIANKIHKYDNDVAHGKIYDVKTILEDLDNAVLEFEKEVGLDLISYIKQDITNILEL